MTVAAPGLGAATIGATAAGGALTAGRPSSAGSTRKASRDDAFAADGLAMLDDAAWAGAGA